MQTANIKENVGFVTCQALDGVDKGDDVVT